MALPHGGQLPVWQVLHHHEKSQTQTESKRMRTEKQAFYTGGYRTVVTFVAASNITFAFCLWGHAYILPKPSIPLLRINSTDDFFFLPSPLPHSGKVQCKLNIWRITVTCKLSWNGFGLPSPCLFLTERGPEGTADTWCSQNLWF